MTYKPVDPRLRALATMSVGDDCWIWHGSPDSSGYGRIFVDGRRVAAYRFMYEWLVGPIPVGLHLDHLCHGRDTACPGGPQCPHRRCVRPDHLEPVTKAENNRRGRNGPGITKVTHCPQGHEYTPENTRTWKTARGCRICAREACRRYHDRQRLAAAALAGVHIIEGPK